MNGCEPESIYHVSFCIISSFALTNTNYCKAFMTKDVVFYTDASRPIRSTMSDSDIQVRQITLYSCISFIYFFERYKAR